MDDVRVIEKILRSLDVGEEIKEVEVVAILNATTVTNLAIWLMNAGTRMRKGRMLIW